MKSAVETKAVIFNNLILNFMKRLLKLEINSERIISKKEQLIIRGGYDGGSCGVDCKGHSDYCYDGCTTCNCNIPGSPGDCFCTSP